MCSNQNTKVENNPIDQSPIIKVKDAVLQYEKINTNNKKKVIFCTVFFNINRLSAVYFIQYTVYVNSICIQIYINTIQCILRNKFLSVKVN